MVYSEDQIRSMVRRILLRTLGPDGEEQPAKALHPQRASGKVERSTVTEADVLAVPIGGQLSIAPNATITPLARDTALERRIKLVPGTVARPVTGHLTPTNGDQIVAIGADHGGYAMKEDLKAYVDGLGFAVVDCGTSGTESVDYPDYAYAVAKLVSDQRAWRGIIVDGAGIGSCMAANKVPGVRAAMCYDHATASNAREHNDANVLTLGGALLGANLARQVVQTWLQTDFGGGRHARRVNKIMSIEQRFIRK